MFTKKNYIWIHTLYLCAHCDQKGWNGIQRVFGNFTTDLSETLLPLAFWQRIAWHHCRAWCRSPTGIRYLLQSDAVLYRTFHKLGDGDCMVGPEPIILLLGKDEPCGLDLSCNLQLFSCSPRSSFTCSYTTTKKGTRQGNIFWVLCVPVVITKYLMTSLILTFDYQTCVLS